MSSILKPLQLDEPQTKSTNLARSRRKTSPKVTEPTVVPHIRRQVPLSASTNSIPFIDSFRSIAGHIDWKEYLLHLPLLISALLAYCGVIFIFGWIEPRSIQNIFLPNSYAPLLLVCTVANFCLFSYFFLNSRRGIIVSIVITILLFLRLQQVLTLPISLSVILLGGAIEVAYLVLRFFYRKVAHRLSLPTLPKLPRKESEQSSLTPQPFASSTAELSPRQRKHGRKRKHHFFGK